MNAKLLLLPVLALSLATRTLADIDVSIAAEIRLGRVIAPPPPEVIIIENTGPSGPPPWAPAHGFRRNRDYYYYPGTNVYYRPADRTWFYLEGQNWRFGVNLPDAVRVDFGHSVAVVMETDRPYEFHEHIRRYYPTDYFVTKVRVKEKGGKPGKVQVDTGHGDDDHRGQKSEKSKGKGKNKDR